MTGGSTAQRAVLVAAAALLQLVVGCTEDGGTAPDPRGESRSTEPTAAPMSLTSSASTPAPPSTTRESPSPSADTSTTKGPSGAERFRAGRALVNVRHLAIRIGPRHATSPAFAEAVDWAASRLRRLGYDVRRQPVAVPGGVSWGVPVTAGTSYNVIAATPDFAPRKPYVLVGAHLDTVPPAPGAEDNASGVSVVLELARLGRKEGTRLPVVFVLFGAEEPRGDGDDLHHFGSTAYVARMSRPARSNLQAMVSLDRVGVGSVIPICTGGLSPPVVQRQLLSTAAEADIPTSRCDDNQSSDHWSFEKAGLAAVRVGGTPYAEYHSAADLPPVVDQGQLRRVGAMMWSWLRS